MVTIVKDNIGYIMDAHGFHILERDLREQCENDKIDVIVVAVAITRYEMLLLVRRAPNVFMGGEYELPGGYVSVKETLEMAIKRQVAEEVGLTTTEILGMIESFDYEYKSQKVRQYNFVVRVLDTPIRLDPGEHDKYIYVTKNSVKNIKLTPEMSRVVSSFFAFIA